jgi:hypothetical protein
MSSAKLYKRAYELHRAKDFDGALSGYLSLLQEFPNSWEAGDARTQLKRLASIPSIAPLLKDFLSGGPLPFAPVQAGTTPNLERTESDPATGPSAGSAASRASAILHRGVRISPGERVVTSEAGVTLTSHRVEGAYIYGWHPRKSGRTIIPLENVDSCEIAYEHRPILLVLGLLLLPAFGFGLLLIIAYFLSRERVLSVNGSQGRITVPVSPSLSEERAISLATLILSTRGQCVLELLRNGPPPGEG